jgi:hypothetical protein
MMTYADSLDHPTFDLTDSVRMDVTASSLGIRTHLEHMIE